LRRKKTEKKGREKYDEKKINYVDKKNLNYVDQNFSDDDEIISRSNNIINKISDDNIINDNDINDKKNKTRTTAPTKIMGSRCVISSEKHLLLLFCRDSGLFFSEKGCVISA
jgi:hypothetical protein